MTKYLQKKTAKGKRPYAIPTDCHRKEGSADTAGQRGRADEANLGRGGKPKGKAELAEDHQGVERKEGEKEGSQTRKIRIGKSSL